MPLFRGHTERGSQVGTGPLELPAHGRRTHPVDGGDVRWAQAAERSQHTRPDSRGQLGRGANEIHELGCVIGANGRGDVERGLNRSEPLGVSGSAPGRRPKPKLSDPGDVAARATWVEPREGSHDPEQRLLGQIIRRVPVNLAREEPGKQRQQLSEQRIDRARLALLRGPDGRLELGIVRPGPTATS